MAEAAVRSMLTEEASKLAAGPELFDASDTEEEPSLKTTVPSEQEAAVTVKEEPETAEGVNKHPVAVPALEKSAAVRPEMLSEKARV